MKTQQDSTKTPFIMEQELTTVSDDFQLFMEDEFEKIEQSIKAFEVIIDIMDEEQFDLIVKNNNNL